MFHKNSNTVSNQSKVRGPRPRANPSLPVTINLMELKDKLESAKVKVLEEEMRKLQVLSYPGFYSIHLFVKKLVS